jgi:hypothetical protein
MTVQKTVALIASRSRQNPLDLSSENAFHTHAKQRLKLVLCVLVFERLRSRREDNFLQAFPGFNQSFIS